MFRIASPTSSIPFCGKLDSNLFRVDCEFQCPDFGAFDHTGICTLASRHTKRRFRTFNARPGKEAPGGPFLGPIAVGMRIMVNGSDG
jgi:hypothetical protein